MVKKKAIYEKFKKTTNFLFFIILFQLSGFYIYTCLIKLFAINTHLIELQLFILVSCLFLTIKQFKRNNLSLFNNYRYIVASIIIVLIILAWQPTLIPTSGNDYFESQITISTISEKNEHSKAHQVWILNYSKGELYIDVTKFNLSDGWTVSENAIGTEGFSPPLTLPIYNYPTKIIFAKNDWSGKVRIQDGRNDTIIDLYSDTFSTFEYKVLGNYSPPSTNERYFSLLSTISFFFIIVFMYFVNCEFCPEKVILSWIRRQLIIISEKNNFRCYAKKKSRNTNLSCSSIRSYNLCKLPVSYFFITLTLSIITVLLLNLFLTLNITLSTVLRKTILISSFFCFNILLNIIYSIKHPKINLKKYLSLKKIATAAIFSVLFYNSLFEVIIPLHDKTTISIQSSQEKNIASLNHEVWISKIKLNGKNLDLSLISLPSNGWLYNGNIVAVVQDIPLQLEIASKNAEIHFLTTQYSGIVSLNDADSVEEIDLYSEKNVPAIYTVKESFVSYDSMQLFLYKTLIGLSLFIYSLFFVLFLPTSSFLRGLALPLLFWNSIKLIQTNIPSAWYLVLLLLFFIISLYTLRKKGPFIKLVRSDKSFFSPLAICLINLFVTYSLFAESLFFSNGILIYTLSNLSFLISFCLFLVLIEVFIYNIFFKTINKYIYSSSITPSRKEVLKLASTVFIILVTIWGVYLYGYFPANMSADSYVQYFQATGEWPLDDWHPIYHTLFLRLILNLWKHPAAISLFQIAFLASIITLLLSHFYKKGIHAGIIIRIALLIGILPSNGISIVTLWKDYPFTTALLWLTYVFIRYLDNPKQFNHSISLNIQLFVASLCTAFFRHNGILVFFTVSLFFLLSSLRNKRYWLLLNAILMTFTVVFFQGPLLNHLDVIKTSKPARYIAPLHDIYGVYEAGYEITDDAENALFSEVPKQYWVDNYNPYTAATIMFGNDYRYIDSLSSFSSLDIIKIYLKNFLRHPIPVIYNRLRSSSLLWYIIQPSDGYSFRYSTSIDKNIDIGVNKAANTITRILNNYLLFSHSNILLDVLFWRPAILLFILLFLAVSFADAFSKQVFIILIPLLSNLITLLFSMSFQDFRYGYFITLLTPFVIVSFVITAKNTIALKKTVALSKKEVTIGYTDGKKQTSNDRLEKKPTMGINEKKEVGVIIHGCSLSIILLSLTLISNFQYLSEFFYFSIFIVYIIAYYFLTGVSPLKNKEYIFFLLLAFSSPVIVNSFSSASLHYQEILNVLWKLSLAFLVIQLSEIHSNKKSNTHLPKSKSVDESIIAIYLSIISAIVIDNSMHEFQYIENLITRIAGVCTASILLFPFWLTLIHTTGLLLDYLHSDHSISNGDKFYNYYPIPIKMSSYSINNSDSPSRRKKMFYLVLSSIIALFVFLYDVETNTYYQIVRYSLSVLFIYYTLFLFDKYLAFPKTKVLRFLLLFLSLLAGFAASFYLPEKASHQPFSNNQLTITLQEEVNTESKGREVWIKSINDENGLNLDLNPETLPEGWKVQPENNWYYSTTANKPLSINTNGPISIDFLKHYWSGKVRIEEENSRKTIDLFFAGYESEIYKSNDIQKTDFLTKDLYRAIVFLVFGIITYIVSLLIIHTPLFIIPIIGFFAFAMPNGFFLNVLDNKANVSSFEKKYIPPFDNLSNYNHSTPTVTVPNNRLSIDRIISEGLLNEIIYKSLLFPLISSSKIKMTDLALIEFKDNVYFTDYDFSNSYQYYFYTKETPFIFSEDKPLNGSKSYIFSRPSTDIESNKIDRFDMIVSLPVINLNQNRAFLIKRKTEDGIIDPNEEYLLKLVKDNNIIIDGSFEDWLPIPPLITYPEKQLELKITKSKNSLFFYLSYKFSNEKENVKSITPFLVIFFDTDNDPTTGLSIVRTSNQEKESNSTFGSNAVLINSSLIKQDHNTVYSKETGFADIRTGNSIPGNQMMEIELPLTLLFDNNEYEEGDTFKIVTCFVYDGQYMTLNDEPILLAILDESVSPEEQR